MGKSMLVHYILLHLPRIFSRSNVKSDPGCAVDIPAVLYSLSFAPNPEFSEVFPSQGEILEYFNDVAERFDVSRHIVPNTKWEGAYWQDLTSTWLVKLKNLSNGETFFQECKLLISAVGGLVDPNPFNVPGVDVFEGDIIHTARWKADTSLAQKDVVIVGNGCKSLIVCSRTIANSLQGSAAQLVPSIADEVKSISQFIRVRLTSNTCDVMYYYLLGLQTPQHYLQNENMQIDEGWRLIFRHVPGVMWLFRVVVFLYLESTASRFNVDGNGTKARNQSAERSQAYIKRSAPGVLHKY